MARRPTPPKEHPHGEELHRLSKIMERARRSRRRAEADANRIYAEMKRRDPEFWKAFGFETEEEYLRYYDLTDLIK